MSSYVREKVLRVPATAAIEDYLKSLMSEEDREDWADELEYKLRDLFGYADIGKFQRAPTVELFIDFVLEYEYDADGEYGYVRELYDNEKYDEAIIQYEKFLSTNQGWIEDIKYALYKIADCYLYKNDRSYFIR